MAEFCLVPRVRFVTSYESIQNVKKINDITNSVSVFLPFILSLQNEDLRHDPVLAEWDPILSWEFSNPTWFLCNRQIYAISFTKSVLTYSRCFDLYENNPEMMHEGLFTMRQM